MSRDPKAPSVPGEIEVIGAFHQEIGAYLSSLIGATRLVERAFVDVAKAEHGPPVTRNVQVALLSNLTNHLRAMTREAALANPEPVATVAATVFELAFTITYIGGREDRATKWANHEDPVKSVWSVTALVNAVVGERTGDTSGQQATRVYQNYSQLCMGKHANPLLAAHLILQEDRILAGIGPNPSPASVRVLQFALEQGVGLAHGVLVSILDSRLIPSPSPDLDRGVTDLGDTWSALHEKSLVKWGIDDPHPQKWRRLRGVGPGMDGT